MSETAEAPYAATPETGNTIPPPPRLRGVPQDDLQAVQAWVADLHRTLVREANIIGTLRVLLDRVNDLDARLRARETETTQFDGLAFMPGSVSGTYVGAELAAAYDKINQIIAILRSP